MGELAKNKYKLIGWSFDGNESLDDILADIIINLLLSSK